MNAASLTLRPLKLAGQPCLVRMDRAFEMAETAGLKRATPAVPSGTFQF